MSAVECFVLVRFFCFVLMYVLLCVYIKEGRPKKCTWNLEQKVGMFAMVLSSRGTSFHSLSLAPEKVLSPAQMSFTLMEENSIVPE